MRSEITASAKSSTAPYAKRRKRSGGLQCPCIDFHPREITTKQMQDAIDSAGMNEQVKILHYPKLRGS